MSTLVEFALSNLLMAAALAVPAALAGWWGRRPALTHGLWLLVLLKLVTPPLCRVPIALPDAPSSLCPWGRHSCLPTNGRQECLPHKPSRRWRSLSRRRKLCCRRHCPMHLLYHPTGRRGWQRCRSLSIPIRRRAVAGEHRRCHARVALRGRTGVAGRCRGVADAGRGAADALPAAAALRRAGPGGDAERSAGAGRRDGRALPAGAAAAGDHLADAVGSRPYTAAAAARPTPGPAAAGAADDAAGARIGPLAARRPSHPLAGDRGAGALLVVPVRVVGTAADAPGGGGMLRCVGGRRCSPMPPASTRLRWWKRSTSYPVLRSPCRRWRAARGTFGCSRGD